MKRKGHLFERIIAFDSLEKAYYKACLRKRGRPAVMLFRLNETEQLEAVREAIISGRIPTGPYEYFDVVDPKPRRICAAAFPDRIVHHAIMNILEPIFENYQIYHSYACRSGKGTHAALSVALRH